MDAAHSTFSNRRTNPRYPPRAQNIRLSNQRKEVERKEEERRPRAVTDEFQSFQQKYIEKHHITMTKGHRFFHRQAPAPTQVVTVNVEIIATVDSSGNILGHETRTQAEPAVPTPGPAVAAAPAAPAAPAASPVVNPAAAPVPAIGDVAGQAAAQVSGAGMGINAVPPEVPVPATPSLPQVPAVPPMPTNALPAVPSVPAFPSQLTVPPYPWPSGVSAQVAQVSIPVTSSSALRSASGNSAISSLSATPNPASNSTTMSTASGLSSLDSISASLNSVSMTISGRHSSSDETASSRRGSPTGSPGAASRTDVGGAGGGGPANTAAAPAGTAAVGSGATGNSTPLQTPQVVGSVVGSLAGAALILAIILLLLRRHKKKRQGTLQLTNDETADRAQPMAQRASWGNRIPSTFLNRFSGMSRSTAETSTSGGERSFQRVSGRKLPSAFSEGMTSEQFSRGGTMSGQSFYQDDHGTYGGPGISKEFGKEIGGSPGTPGAGMMNIRPSPARTPVIRHPDEEANPFADPTPFPKARSPLSPPQSPNPEAPPRGTLGRSLHSHDGSRSSKFTENV